MFWVERLKWRRPRMMNPIAQAFVLSLLCHLVVFTGIEMGNRLDLWRFSPLLLLARALNLSPATVAALTAKAPPTPKPAVSKPAETPEVPLVFVDVDPSQASDEAPKETPYYSPLNSLAGNPDTSRDTGTPKLEGKQTRVMKTADTLRAATPAARPLQPTPPAPQPPPEPATAQARPPQPTPAPAQPTPPQPAAPPEPKEERIGDLAMAKPVPPTNAQPAATASAQPTPAAEAAKPQPTRPRTVAAARAQQRTVNPNSATLGEKLKQEGGVPRFTVQSSLDVKRDELGDYDAKFIAAVQACWYGLLEEHRYALDREGKVVLKFRLWSDGRVTDMSTMDENVGEVFTLLCHSAVKTPAPYDKWTLEMRKRLRENYREVTFTFYY
jgi:hypothetical protein